MTINTSYYFAQVEQIQQHLNESEKTLQEQIFKLEAQKTQLEEVRFGFEIIYLWTHQSFHASIEAETVFSKLWEDNCISRQGPCRQTENIHPKPSCREMNEYTDQ